MYTYITNVIVEVDISRMFWFSQARMTDCAAQDMLVSSCDQIWKTQIVRQYYYRFLFALALTLVARICSQSMENKHIQKLRLFYGKVTQKANRTAPCLKGVVQSSDLSALPGFTLSVNALRLSQAASSCRISLRSRVCQQKLTRMECCAALSLLTWIL